MSGARIPANIDREDPLVAGLSARQLAELAAAAVVGLAVRAATMGWPAGLSFGLALIPVGAGIALALGRFDGLNGDRFVLAWLAHRRRPSLQVAAPEGVPAPPAGLPKVQVPAPLELPVRGVDEGGIVDLGQSGSALVCRASALNFGLRTEMEQQALVGLFAGWLNGLSAPVEILVRTEPVDVDELVGEVEATAGSLPHPDLEAAAREHARFVAELVGRRNVLRREILLVFHDTAAPEVSAAALLQRAEDAVVALSAAGIVVEPLSELDARRTLARSAEPDRPANLALLDWMGASSGADQAPAGRFAKWWSRRPGRQSLAACLPLVPSMQITPRRLRVGDGVRRTEAIVAYPHDVRLGWLEPLVTHPGPVDVALHIEPVPAPIAAARLRRQVARFESTRRIGEAKGRIVDPGVSAAADDAGELADRLARGDGRLFAFGLYATVRGAGEEDADAELARLRSLLGSLLLEAVPATYRALQGWLSTLPLGLDLLRLRRTVDTDALAAACPFASAEASHQGGVLVGVNSRTGGIVSSDCWAQRNHNTVVLASSGAGKSYMVKLDLIRSLYGGVEAAVIDPEGEYTRLADAVGGTVVGVGAPGVRLNPFDLGSEDDALDRRAMFIHTLVAVLLGAEPDAAEAAALDRAIHRAYSGGGITGDPRTHRRPPPVLADLVDALQEGGAAGIALADRLEPYVTGSRRELFAGPTTTAPDGHLVVFSLRQLPDEMRAVGTLLVLDAIWRRVADPRSPKRRVVVVDEGWLLMQDPAGARFLFRLAKSARKHWCGLTTVTQDAADVLGSELGQAVVANAATQVLMRQSAQAMPALAEAFRLSDGEQRFLLASRRGEGLLLAGTERIAFSAVASPAEHRLVTTDPEFLASLDNPDANSGIDEP